MCSGKTSSVSDSPSLCICAPPASTGFDADFLGAGEVLAGTGDRDSGASVRAASTILRVRVAMPEAYSTSVWETFQARWIPAAWPPPFQEDGPAGDLVAAAVVQRRVAPTRSSMRAASSAQHSTMSARAAKLIRPLPFDAERMGGQVPGRGILGQQRIERAVAYRQQHGFAVLPQCIAPPSWRAPGC